MKVHISSPLIGSEIQRIHLELMNKEVLTLLDDRLREGRLMDVMQIARSISKHRRSIVISNTLRYTH